MIKTFEVPNKYGDGKVSIKRYILDKDQEPSAVVFGKFIPWSGKKGHGKLVDFAKKNFKEVFIASPTRSGKDKNVDIFTDEQKEKFIEIANPDIKFHRVKSGPPIRMFTELINLGIERPVLIVGEDRERDFAKYFRKYDKNNEPIEDVNDKDFGKGEYLVVSRTDEDTSASKVRKALIDGDKEAFLKLTGYEEKMWDIMSSMSKKVNEEMIKKDFVFNADDQQAAQDFVHDFSRRFKDLMGHVHIAGKNVHFKNLGPDSYKLVTNFSSNHEMSSEGTNFHNFYFDGK